MSKNKKPKFGLFITARVDSSRLPNKMLLPIRGKPVIEHDIVRAKQARNPDIIILCTTKRSKDDILVELAKKHGIEYYRGSLSDKLGRWLSAAKSFGLDYFVEYDGDDLFCDPELIDFAIKQVVKKHCDFLKVPGTLVCGGVGPCMSVPALKKVCQIKATDDTETVWWNYFTDTGLFQVRDLEVKERVFHNPNIRLTLDYQEDFDFFKKVFEELDIKVNKVPLRQILQFLNKRPELAKINFFRQQDFADNQKKKTKLVLK
ncbi:MAG: hypothetical protein HYT61_01165 [Candidatus Yanofskybacteria bacterium]|nr:hypothetical protein [Candidatus Yanofskybacteria bacterium]